MQLAGAPLFGEPLQYYCSRCDIRMCTACVHFPCHLACMVGNIRQAQLGAHSCSCATLVDLPSPAHVQDESPSPRRAGLAGQSLSSGSLNTLGGGGMAPSRGSGGNLSSMGGGGGGTQRRSGRRGVAPKAFLADTAPPPPLEQQQLPFEQVCRCVIARPSDICLCRTSRLSVAQPSPDATFSVGP